MTNPDSLPAALARLRAAAQLSIDVTTGPPQLRVDARVVLALVDVAEAAYKLDAAEVITGVHVARIGYALADLTAALEVTG